MRRERQNGEAQLNGEEVQVYATIPVEQLRDEHVTLRRALRDCLAQAGIPTNPAWTSQDLIHATAALLGVEDRYHEAGNVTRSLSHRTSIF